MAIVLKQVLDGHEGQQELTSILNEQTSQLKAQVEAKRSQANMATLEGELNGIFYPQGITTISADYYVRTISSLTEENLYKVFNDFDFESNATGHYEAKRAMSPNTLISAMEIAQKGIDMILQKIANSDETLNKKHLEDLILQAQQKIKEGEVILDQAAEALSMQTQKRLRGDSFQQAFLIVNQLRAFSETLSNAGISVVTPQQAGVIFEEALALTNFVEDSSTIITEELRQKAIELTQTGANLVTRGGDKVSYGMSVKYLDDETLKSIKNGRNFKMSKDNMTITYSYNPSQARQGKMDVQLNYNGNRPEDYRVSAKRWTNARGDLGETSIDAGLTRAVGISVAEAYKMAVLTPAIDTRDPGGDGVPTYTAVNAAHELAILALKSDIAMGLNQGEAGYANVLVVDTGTNIKVRDLATIVLDNNAYKLSKYNPSDIQGIANSNYYRIANSIMTGRSAEYLSLMTSSLNKMMVTINLAFPKK